MSLAVDLIEFDVQQTQDGILVVLHDKRVDRTTNGTGYVRDMTFGEIRQLDLPGGEKIPSLQESLDVIRGQAEILLEIIDPEISVEVLDLLESNQFLGATIIASFHHQDLIDLRTKRPSIRTLALLEGIPVEPTRFARDAEATFVGLSIDTITPKYVRCLHEAGLGVMVYTVNDVRDIQYLETLGVEGIISDYPERVPKS